MAIHLWNSSLQDSIKTESGIRCGVKWRSWQVTRASNAQVHEFCFLLWFKPNVVKNLEMRPQRSFYFLKWKLGEPQDELVSEQQVRMFHFENAGTLPFNCCVLFSDQGIWYGLVQCFNWSKSVFSSECNLGLKSSICLQYSFIILKRKMQNSERPKHFQLGVELNWYRAEFFLPQENTFHHPLKLATFRNKQLDVKYPSLITTPHIPKPAL